jgi:hypothetical protein
MQSDFSIRYFRFGNFVEWCCAGKTVNKKKLVLTNNSNETQHMFILNTEKVFIITFFFYFKLFTKHKSKKLPVRLPFNK